MSSDKLDQKILELTNKERAKYGLDSLSIDSQLDQAANLHTDEMVQSERISHDGLDERSTATGYEYVAENVAYNFNSDPLSPEEAAELAVQSLMRSEGHRENILNPDFAYLGVGYGNDSDSDDLDNYTLDDASGKNYFTQIFAADNVDV